MKFKNPLLVVKDLQLSKEFYSNVLGLRTIADFGENVILTGGISLQTEGSWSEFINCDTVCYGGKDAEIYFEEDNFDEFVIKLEKISCIEYVHPVIEHRWGQRVVRFYDPDKHIIEVGETMGNVCQKFVEKGMTATQVAKRMDIPLKNVNALLKKYSKNNSTDV